MLLFFVSNSEYCSFSCHFPNVALFRVIFWMLLFFVSIYGGQSRWAPNIKIIEKRKGRGERRSKNCSQLINALFLLLSWIKSGEWGSIIRLLPTILEPDCCRIVFPSVVLFFFFRIIKLFLDKNVDAHGLYLVIYIFVSSSECCSFSCHFLNAAVFSVNLWVLLLFASNCLLLLFVSTDDML